MASQRVAAIVLAAGASRRLGQPKQLVLLAGQPLLARAVRLALEAGCRPVFVVLGAAEPACRAVLAGFPPGQVLIVTNPDWAEGMSTSIRCGVAAAAASAFPPDALMVLVADQIGLTVASLQQLLQTHSAGSHPITAALYSGRLGVPALFSAEAWPTLSALTGDQGARQLLSAWRDRVTAVPTPEATADLDTPNDLAQLSRS